MTFSLELTSAQAIADQDKATRRAAIKAECRRRILAVLDKTTQMNLAGDAAAGRLDRADRSAHAASLIWRDAMRAHAAELGTKEQAVFTDDSAWPAPDAQITELATRV